MNSKTTDILRNLIKLNVDSCKGFDLAADAIASDPIARLFRQIGRDRRRHVEVLRSITEITDEEADDGSALGAAHRWWLTARGSLNSGADHVVLVEAARGESAIMCQYEEAIESIGDPALLRVIRDQYAEVKRGHDAVCGLRDMAAIC